MASDHDGTDGGEGVTFSSSTGEETPNEGNSQSNKIRDEVQMEWISLRHELMDLLDRKEEKIQRLIQRIPLPQPPGDKDSQSSLKMPRENMPRQITEESNVSMPDFLKETQGDLLESEAEKMKFASKATSGRTFRQEKGLRRYIQKGTHLGMFVDSMSLRGWLEGAITKVEYLQSLQEPPRTSCLARTVDSSTFQFFCTVVILANCLTLLLQANWSMEHQSFDVPLYLRVMDLSFTSFYVIELILKLIVHRHYFFWHHDWRWNVFDFVLVILAVQEQVLEYMAAQNVTRISYMRSLRLVRVSRVLRLLRAIRVIRELRMMVFSIMSSLNALFWCLVLVSLVICVFALFFLQISTDYLILDKDSIDPEEFKEFMRRFGSLDKTMQTLYLATTGGFDWEDALRLVGQAGQGGTWAFLFYIAFFNFAVFNVLTGMFVDHAMKWSQSDNQNQIAERRSQEQADAARLKRLCEAMDIAKTGRISWDDFEQYVSNESALIYLASLGLEIHDAKTFFDMLTGVSDDKYVDIDTFVKGCMRMKGPATSIDMLSMGYEVTLIHRQNRRVEAQINELCQWQRQAQPILDMCSSVKGI